MSSAYRRYKNYYKQDDDKIRALKAIHRTKKTNSYTAKENRVILDQWTQREDLVEAIDNLFKKIELEKYKPPRQNKKSKSKKNMTLEVLFSDVHYGKYIDNIEGNFVNLEVIRSRVRKVSDSVVKEIEREKKSFNVERCIIAMIGDIIENADFHGMESTKACEFSTSRQVQESINSIFHDLILPIALTGIRVDIPCVTGNHDRVNHNKTYVKPGEDNLTYIIYHTLQMLCKQSGLKNVTFDIPNGLVAHSEIYGNVIAWEHGDELRNINRDTLFNQMSRRSHQIGKVINFYRVGHFHEPTSFGQGKAMVNGSVPGQDDYAQSKGFSSEPIQILNYYVETDKRSTCFFRSFPIYLSGK